ncbi:MAG TPA: GTP cyclohydrolase I FolE [Dehalococcoidia bacterium]|jgi:GTP cyclohydrolase I|nr:GTP cyclohydrolase I FolE [Chloroflexota bacterium]MDP6055234.1 GTP cyclohydrolase I FolE [Dehalococcoidia bacterium]MDP7484871.1 GTP cyclohydrolase I FolE [Dehalococcoidia bacterium]HJP28527.1 GTP cyclohydrolase I FolE [Dehalococcoidia bacterium]|tara:strand:- start:15783 stop:16412 length:630 start_codon:yes stop_codon:yes gene_type:complete
MSIKDISITNASPEFDFEDGTLLSASCKQVIADGISAMLQIVGDDVDTQGTAGTPKRVANMYDELLSGYSTDPVELLNGALFDVEYDEMIIVKDIDFYSLCEHHLLPFYGRAHVGYIPKQKVIGLSKIPRLIEMFGRRLQVQERMTQQIATSMDELIQPTGIGVVIEAKHLCATMRGVRKPNTIMTTSAVRGQFKKNSLTREEFFSHVR